MEGWLVTNGLQRTRPLGKAPGQVQHLCARVFIRLTRLPAGCLLRKLFIVPDHRWEEFRRVCKASSAKLRQRERRTTVAHRGAEEKYAPTSPRRELTGWLNEGSAAVAVQRPYSFRFTTTAAALLTKPSFFFPPTLCDSGPCNGRLKQFSSCS